MFKVKFFTNNSYESLNDPHVVEIPDSAGEVFVVVNGRDYRFAVKEDGSMEICLINGTDVRVTQAHGYPSVKLIHV